MLRRGNENPYLKGKSPKKHIPFVLKEEDPLRRLDEDQRKAVIKALGKSAQQEFTKHLQRLQMLVREYNPFQILAHFAYYDQLFLDGSGESHGYTPTEQSAVEWLQALVLQVQESDISRVLDEGPFGEPLLQINASLHAAFKGFGLMRLGRDTEETDSALAAELMRQHTAFVRNDGFPSQIKRLHREILRSLDAEFRAREGYSLSMLSEALWKLLKLLENRINDDFAMRRQVIGQSTAKQIIAKFAEITEQTPESVEKDMAEFSKDKQAVTAAVINWLDWRNFRLFYFKEAEFSSLFPPELDPETIRGILDDLSITLGGLSSGNPEHFILSNPVWTKPFISVGNGSFFFPFISMVQSFGLGMVEQALKKHSHLWAKYCSRVRAEFLEARTEEAVRKAFPMAQVFRGLKWTDDADGLEGENDVLVLLDTHALVFECKSGRVRDRARRGDPAALKEELEKLIGDPSRQGKRFADYLLKKKAIIKLIDSKDVWHELDLRALLRATTVNVTLEYLGPVGIQHQLLRRSGLVSADAAPTATIPFHDFECILEILDSPPLAFHYFRRRAEIESANEIMTDEIGLLAMYLATSFDLGDFEGDETRKFVVPTMAEELTPDFMERRSVHPCRNLNCAFEVGGPI